jgi:hypothetical protein
MPTIVRLLWVLCFTSVLGVAHAAPIHTVTWAQKNAPIGKEVTLGGQTLVLVRLPLQPFSGSQRYAVSFLAPADQSFGLLTTLVTQHSRDPLEEPIDIDGFDATVVVSDGRNYTLGPAFPPPCNTCFSVTAQVTCSVHIKVGTATLLSLFQVFEKVQQPPTELEEGDPPDAVPLANWAAYKHPNAQIQACDDWIDYIKIKEVPE